MWPRYWHNVRVGWVTQEFLYWPQPRRSRKKKGAAVRVQIKLVRLTLWHGSWVPRPDLPLRAIFQFGEIRVTLSNCRLVSGSIALACMCASANCTSCGKDRLSNRLISGKKEGRGREEEEEEERMEGVGGCQRGSWVNQIIFCLFDMCHSGACCGYVTVRTSWVHRWASAISAW